MYHGINMSEKIIGYFLLFTGILIILFSALSVYNVFTKKSKPVDLFNLAGISIDIGKLQGRELTPFQEEQLKKSGGSTEAELVAPEIINQPLNLIFHLLLMGFMANIGLKLASVGSMFLRPIKVSLKGGEILNQVKSKS